MPALATKWSISPDRLRFRFHLGKDARFASGRKVTSEAVRFSLERLIRIGEDPPKSIPIAQASSRYVPLKEVRIVGPYKVDLIMKERWATTLTGLSTAMCSIVDGPSVEMGHDLGHTWLRRHSAGSGPYTISQISEHRVVLVENRNHWRENPRIKRVVILDGRDPATEEERLRRGKIDVSTVVTLRTLREFVTADISWLLRWFLLRVSAHVLTLAHLPDLLVGTERPRVACNAVVPRPTPSACRSACCVTAAGVAV